MSADRILTFEQTIPHRPGEADVLNGRKENRTETVPPQMLAAEEFEQMARLVVALSRMCPVLRVSVQVTVPSVPVIASLACIRGDVVIGDFSVFYYADGDYELRYASAKFPASATQPMVTLNTNIGDSRAPAAIMTSPSAGVTGVRVKTANSAGTLAAIPFTLEVF